MNNLRDIGDACWDAFNFAHWQRAIGDCQAIPVNDEMIYIATRGVVGNVTVVRTGGGLVVFDTGSLSTASKIYGAMRSWNAAPIHTVVFTHGHVDHVMGMSLFDEEARRRGEPPIRVIAHRNMPARFDRYIATAGLNANINSRQFAVPGFKWPNEFRYPDLTFDDKLSITVGDTDFELHHGMGETDDHTWTSISRHSAIVSGDFVIWAAPNCGNPQKVQRYCKPWADALRAMGTKNASALVPGHGPAIFGSDRVSQVLQGAVSFLDSIHSQTLALMNEGKTLDETISAVKIPKDLLARPYLQPTYDDPEFLIRNIWRLYAGWWDGDPAHLKPAPSSLLAAELAYLAGGSMKLAERARMLASQGDLRLAGHLIEFATKADPKNHQVHQARIEINQKRASAEPTLMARGIFNAAVRESQAVADPGALAAAAPRNVGIG